MILCAGAGVDYLVTFTYSPDTISLLIKYHLARATEEYVLSIGSTYASILNTIMSHPSEQYSKFTFGSGIKETETGPRTVFPNML